jgi:hypothetical protein
MADDRPAVVVFGLSRGEAGNDFVGLRGLPDSGGGHDGFGLMLNGTVVFGGDSGFGGGSGAAGLDAPANSLRTPFIVEKL